MDSFFLPLLLIHVYISFSFSDFIIELLLFSSYIIDKPEIILLNVPSTLKGILWHKLFFLNSKFLQYELHLYKEIKYQKENNHFYIFLHLLNFSLNFHKRICIKYSFFVWLFHYIEIYNIILISLYS